MNPLLQLVLMAQSFGAGAPPGELIFHSGFEPGSEVVPGRGSDHRMVGRDRSLAEKSDWEATFGGELSRSGFPLQYTGGEISQRFARIVAEPGNPANRVLWFWLDDAWQADGGVVKARVQANIYGVRPGFSEFRQLVRVFLPRDWDALKRYPRAVHWCTISEFWNNIWWGGHPNGFRITLGIGKPAGPVDALHFILDAQDPGMKQVWKAENREVQVPIGKWFTMDYSYREGDSRTGRFFLAITPEGEPKRVVYDVTGWTRNTTDPAPDGITDWNPMKLYTSREVVGFMKSQGKTLEIYWDDFRLWGRRMRP